MWELVASKSTVDTGQAGSGVAEVDGEADDVVSHDVTRVGIDRHLQLRSADRDAVVSSGLH